ncbi:MAG: HAD family acid phosphatase [Pseudomonadota bacterium]
MNWQKRSCMFLVLVCLGAAGCTVTGDPEPVPRHDNTDSVIWLQSSTEYAALTHGIYASATTELQAFAETSTRPLDQFAIVLDVDETVLDNSPYQGQLVMDDATYEGESWDRWVALRAATEVPGVVDFIRSSQSLGVHVVFVTNRRCRPRPTTDDTCPQIEDTRVNLEAIGIDTSTTTLFLRGERPPQACRALLTAAERGDGVWSSDKTSRRACVELDRDILMLFGDQLGDFIEKHHDDGSVSGRQTANEYSDRWGKTWFMLPNPTYGGWRPRTSDDKRALIRGID